MKRTFEPLLKGVPDDILLAIAWVAKNTVPRPTASRTTSIKGKFSVMQGTL